MDRMTKTKTYRMRINTLRKIEALRELKNEYGEPIYKSDAEIIGIAVTDLYEYEYERSYIEKKV